MKNHIVFKFLALVLCAAMLFTAVVAGIGIFALNEAGLYHQSWENAYNDYRQDILQTTANAIAARYAAADLGGLSREMLDAYYGDEWYLRQFRFGTMGYTLYDSEQNPLQTYFMTGYEPVEGVVLEAIQQEYPRLVEVMEPTRESVYQSAEGSTHVYDAVPLRGAVVHNVTVGYLDSSEGVGSPDGLGSIRHDENGYVVFEAWEPDLLDVTPSSELISISFENETHGLLYELTDPNGIGLLYSDTGGIVRFQSSVVSPEYAPAATQPEATEAGIPATEAGIQYNGISSGDNIYAAPHAGAEVLGTLTEEDMALTFRGYQVDESLWFLFEKGWVMAEPVTAPEQPDSAAVQGRTVNIYSMPNINAAPTGTLVVDGELTPIRTANVNGADWILIPEGWLLQSELESASVQEPETTGDGAQTTEPTVEPTVEKVTETAPEETVVPGLAETMEPAGEPTAEPTMEPTADPAAEESIPAETMQPQVLPRQLQPNGKYLTYYDPDLRQEMVLQYTLEQTPSYTVAFQLAENALNGDYGWRLLALASNFREYLVPALIGSVLLFAILIVYLCCAAGHKPGTVEIRAGGLSRFPLDGWILVLCAGLACAALLGVEGTEYLMRGSLELGIAFAAALGYGAALLMVCFCFVFAAQIKTPDGFWWRNSLCGLCWKLFVRCLAWGIKTGVILWGWFCRFCKWLARTAREKLLPAFVRLCRSLYKLAAALAAIALKWLNALFRMLKKGWNWIYAWFVRFVAMLPMTWQWLLAGFCIIIVLALTVNTHFGFWGILATIALVLYGAHAFGILLGGVKRMVKGDLDDKVDDKLLIGSFKDFSDELNGLADVVVESARKQLRSERMKTELITNVSHDIKTPLTSIINYVDLLEKPHTEQEQAQYLEVLSRQSQRLKKLIEDLMELSKASTGNMAVEIQTMDGAEVVNQALGEFADKLEKARLIPVFRQPEEPVRMLADGRMVWRVMSNLLGNAVKYALPGTRIYLDLNRVGDQVILSVKNISREELNVEAEELMERFVRGDASRNTEGSGLGLNIARSLMELQKGSLQLLVDGDLFKVTLIFPAAES